MNTVEVILRWLPILVKAIIDIFAKPPSRPPPHVEAVVNVPPPSGNEAVPNEKAGKEKPTCHSEGQRGVQDVIRAARTKMGVDCVKHYNFGVSGQSGVGKSSFINSLLGDYLCPVGEVETTEKVKSYSTKKAPYLILWDLPGAGTIKHPADTYFEDMKLQVFDTILILSSEQFLKVDFEILRSARKYGTPCVFVRTKCDISVHNRAQRDKVNVLEASQRLREDVKANFLANLANAGLQDSLPEPELFFISNHFFSNDEVYALYNKKTRAWDTTLSFMDERQLLTFIHDTARKRVYPSK